MGFAFSVLNWSSNEFWNSTPGELYAAIDGWKAQNGLNDSKEEWAKFAEKVTLKNKELSHAVH